VGELAHGEALYGGSGWKIEKGKLAATDRRSEAGRRVEILRRRKRASG
jgi:hypothetical protein